MDDVVVQYMPPRRQTTLEYNNRWMMDVNNNGLDDLQ